MNQKGFATLEVILMIVVIGILATVAVPRFTDTTVKANTAKIQADLSTLDNAIAIYFMEKGQNPTGTDISVLEEYVKDVENLKPPTGKAYINGEQKEISAKTYSFKTVDKETRAALDDKIAGDFSTTRTSTAE